MTASLALAFDGVVALLVLGLALRLLTTRDLFEAIVLFVAYGLTLSLAWVRLGAPDVALAEAALGAGVTGALLLNAYHRLARRSAAADSDEVDAPQAGFLHDDGARDGPRVLRILLIGPATVVVGMLVWLVLRLEERPAILPVLVDGRLEDSGVSNPVTAVLLNFRAYDTMLEIAVLVAAMVVVWSLDRGSRWVGRDPRDTAEQPVLLGLARLVVPIAGVTAVYLAWAGSHAPGGAFQAGALLAGAGVLLAAAGLLRPPTAATRETRAAVAIGLLAFIAVGVGVMPWTGAFLALPAERAYALILGIEVILTVSIAVALVELFVDVTAVPDPDPSLADVDPTGDPLGRILGPRRSPAEEDEAP